MCSSGPQFRLHTERSIQSLRYSEPNSALYSELGCCLVCVWARTSRLYSSPKNRPSPLQRTSGWASRVFINHVVPDFASPTRKNTGISSLRKAVPLGDCLLRRAASLSTVDPRRAGPSRRYLSAPRYLETDIGILRTD